MPQYAPLTETQVTNLMNLLENGKLVSDLIVDRQDLKLYVHVTKVSKKKDSTEFPNYQMMERILTGNNKPAVSWRKNTADLILNVGKWGTVASLDGGHITLGCKMPGLHSYFSQVELGYCFSYGTTLLITKRISAAGGKGTPQRLFAGSTDLDEKYARLALLKAELGKPTFESDGSTYVVLSQIESNKLNDAAFTTLLGDLVGYAFAVEAIRRKNHGVVAATEKAKNGVYRQITAIEKKRIEMAGEDYAVAHFQNKGYIVQRVSHQRGLGCDIICSKGTQQLHVEVKGTTRKDWCVNITKSEFLTLKEKAKQSSLFVVLVNNVEEAKPIGYLETTLGSSSVLMEPTVYSLKPAGKMKFKNTGS